jgi:hypothetical protein
MKTVQRRVNGKKHTQKIYTNNRKESDGYENGKNGNG